MTDAGSITNWMQQLSKGDRTGVEVLWKAYFYRLVGLAKTNLENSGMMSDAEDVALSAFKSFCLRAEQGFFPQIADRNGLWETLVLITTRKISNLIDHEHRQKRDARRKVSQTTKGDGERPIVADVISREPDPATAAEIAEVYRRLMEILDGDEFRAVAQLKLEGFSNAEIADQIKRSIPTVERRLKAIRSRWLSILENEDSLMGPPLET